MLSAPLPANEDERLKKVLALGLLDSKPEERFDAITREAVEFFKVPIATVTLIDDKREWYKSCQGLDVKQAPREISFCAHAMLSRSIFIVEDTLKDDRFKDNPMVTRKPYIRFYAGVSLYDKDHIPIGVFCIKDTKPRSFGIEVVGAFMDFAARAQTELAKPV
ncbi:MAG: hypothetical protein COT91_01965 [Candidatus Doudnabacteria bacterium CG10_big_fil_rev_8_21_14_0_10_41_10]|uniref:GAF domain-containing protein n=1 Tax=Candidatus Doudnabacteria bacterium CG10_big_fil_rev_8_21_14_0_10_41_10 TaxID=1974551 RepID=A0A2H0VDY5_9BACT|nr:MAG: hypothetical protein COT91_01965 [Candidatus Doudnabacteria bacterium CG10_big_fil_rev_8_21_14_0_10_41_10]